MAMETLAEVAVLILAMLASMAAYYVMRLHDVLARSASNREWRELEEELEGAE